VRLRVACRKKGNNWRGERGGGAVYIGGVLERICERIARINVEEILSDTVVCYKIWV
jgi:hypothetical protein